MAPALGEAVMYRVGAAYEAARETIYGMPQAEWKARHQSEATPEQLQRMAESLKKNA